MTLSKSLRQEALEDLEGEVCKSCGKRKVAKRSFCYLCFKLLPEDMAKALYKRFGHGYEEAYDHALSWLKEERRAKK